jgi:hypothetical protein
MMINKNLLQLIIMMLIAWQIGRMHGAIVRDVRGRVDVGNHYMLLCQL